MKNLLYKELKLAVHPMAYLFLLLASLLLIPDYPYYIAFVYILLSFNIIFMTGKVHNDVQFTVLLPVKKKDVVKARFLIVTVIELMQIIAAIPFAALRGTINPAPNSVGIDANIALFGFVFMMYAVFNAVFLTVFYKSAYKVALPFALAGTAVTAFIVAVEVAVQAIAPLKAALDSPAGQNTAIQLGVLFAGMTVFAATMLLAYRNAVKSFEKVNL